MALSKLETLQILFLAYLPCAALLYWGVPVIVLQFYSAHPWELIVGNFALPALALLYTGPRSKIRLVVPFFAALGFGCYHATALNFMPDRPNAAWYDGQQMFLFQVAVDALLLQRLYLDGSGHERSEVLDRQKGLEEYATWNEDHGTEQDISTLTALKWVVHVHFSFRAIGTRREAKGIPNFSGGQVPSRAKFLLHRGCAIVAAFAYIVSLRSLPRPSIDEFAVHKTKLLLSKPDVTMETVVLRVASTAVFWITLRVSKGIPYNVVSFVGVATFLTAPRDWPPYFGSPTKAYTMRNFWGVFWHIGLRNIFLGPSNFFTYDVIRLRRGTLTARYLSLFLAFGVSGIIHVFGDETLGVPPTENRAFEFFIMQAVGIALEDFAQWMYRVVRPEQQPIHRDKKLEKRGIERGVESWQKLIGFLWVTSWLVFTTPTWSYQNFRLDPDSLSVFSLADVKRNQDPMFPFNLPKLLRAEDP